MAQSRWLSGTTLLAGLMITTAAYADLTPDQVWKTWQDTASSMGQTITVGSQDKADGSLTLKNVTVTSSNKDATVKVAIPEIDMQTNDEGAVEVTLSESVPLTMHTEVPGEATTDGSTPKKSMSDVGMTLSNTGLTITVSGAPGDMTYAVEGDEFGVSLDSLVSDGKPIDMKAAMTVESPEGKSHVTGTDLRQFDGSSSAASITFSLTANNPDGKGTLKVEGNTGQFTSTSKGALPAKMDSTDFAAMLKAGLMLQNTASFGPVTYDASVTGGEKDMSSKGTVEQASFATEMDKDHLKYSTASKGTDIAVTSAALPVPVDVKIAETAFNLLMPVAKSDTSQDFALLTKIDGLAINEEVWGMVDPTAQLPHTPATLIVDLAGKAHWLFDIFDPAQQKAPPAMPGKVEALTLNQLKVTAVGADLSGTGAVTFDNAGPVPKPVGSVDLTLVGGNGVIDKLIAMGMLPKDQAMGARMMLGMFAKPGTAPDTLTSKIEFNADGSILANGQRIQ